ncbi:MAG: hypothetical protein J5I65_15955, partial [Aridibacter famidurans]|nr:hypothetical protein [Aridibacter famidurans]
MINPSTLALEFALPVGGYKGRAGTGLPISISYSSKIWQMYSPPGGSWEHQTWGIVNDVKPMFAQRTAGGWSSSLSVP